jgi:branched-chain amino acid transport system permease protein
VCKNRLGWQAQLLALLIMSLLVPLVITDPGILHIINMMYLMVIPALSLNLIMSTGHVNFAHTAFIAIGAYASTFLSMKAGLSFWLCLPLAGITGALIAWGGGWIVLRIKGPYFFLVTVAFSEVVIRAATRFKEITGGHQGIEQIPKPSITIPYLFDFKFKSETSFYYLMLAAMLVSLIVMYRLQRGHWGLTWRAVREADMTAESAGVDVIRYKVVAFSVSCFFAAMAGSLYAHYVSFINPGSFGLLMMFSLLFSVIVGGREYFYGPFVGTILLRGVSASIARMAQYEPMVYGTILMLVILFFPTGIVSLPSRFATKWQRILHIIRRKSIGPVSD